MTFEERLDKLAERHQAMAQTMELLVGMQRKNEKRFAELLDFMNRLAPVAEAHERRLDRFEGD